MHQFWGLPGVLTLHAFLLNLFFVFLSHRLYSIAMGCIALYCIVLFCSIICNCLQVKK